MAASQHFTPASLIFISVLTSAVIGLQILTFPHLALFTFWAMNVCGSG